MENLVPVPMLFICLLLIANFIFSIQLLIKGFQAANGNKIALAVFLIIVPPLAFIIYLNIPHY